MVDFFIAQEQMNRSSRRSSRRSRRRASRIKRLQTRRTRGGSTRGGSELPTDLFTIQQDTQSNEFLSTPRLLRRHDIWNNFPVSARPIHGVNGVERYGIEWHRSRLRNMEQESDKSVEDLKREIQPRLMRALQASPSWTVEPAGGAGSPYIAIIATRRIGGSKLPGSAVFTIQQNA
jgi:hypothetical protein